MTEYQERLIDELLNRNNREECARILGTSIPTLQRWISKNEYPESVHIILNLRFEKRDLEKRLDYSNMKLIEVKQTVSNFVNSSQALKELISE